VPTFEVTARFWLDYHALTAEQRDAFKAAVRKLVEDLGARAIRPGLRVKGVRGARAIFELTWAPDGRATFQFGDPLRAGEPHIIWRRIGAHAIRARP